MAVDEVLLATIVEVVGSSRKLEAPNRKTLKALALKPLRTLSS